MTIVDFLANFLATLGGVFIAFFLTFEYDRRTKASRETEEQIRVLTAMDLELQANFRDLDIFRKGFINDRTVPLLLFQSAAYNSAVSSGVFSKITSNLQVALAQHYDVGNRWIETLAAKLLSMVGSQTRDPKWPAFAEHLAQLFNDGMIDLANEIPRTRELLKQELSRLDT